MMIFLMDSLNKHTQIKGNVCILASKVYVIFLYCLPHKPGNLWLTSFFPVTTQNPNIVGFPCVFMVIQSKIEYRRRKGNFLQYLLPVKFHTSFFIHVNLFKPQPEGTLWNWEIQIFGIITTIEIWIERHLFFSWP